MTVGDVVPEGRKGVFVRSTRVTPDQSERTQRSLYPGDSIEYGVTHEVEMPDRTKMWLKVNSSTSVQSDETSEQAADRLVSFVHGQLRDRIIQAVQDAGEITLY